MYRSNFRNYLTVCECEFEKIIKTPSAPLLKSLSITKGSYSHIISPLHGVDTISPIDMFTCSSFSIRYHYFLQSAFQKHLQYLKCGSIYATAAQCMSTCSICCFYSTQLNDIKSTIRLDKHCVAVCKWADLKESSLSSRCFDTFLGRIGRLPESTANLLFVLRKNI